MIELLLPCGFDTLEYSWVKATFGICTLTDYSVAKKCQHPPPAQIQEPQKQNEAFPTDGTILAIAGGSNTDFDTKRQCRDYYVEVNHVVV
jgi:hypothetical protein